MSTLDGGNHAALMDANYRLQRHVYDLTRRYYLLGRDRLIDGLDVPVGGSVLEIGCGTGRNLAAVARRYPSATVHGLDISAAMLKTAQASLSRKGMSERVALARGDACAFEAKAVFGRASFDRVFVSYALSMIPDWQAALTAALSAVTPQGSLHIVDFGGQEGLPGWFGAALRAWLARFHVTQRAKLIDEARQLARKEGRRIDTVTVFRGYATLVVVGPQSLEKARATAATIG